VRAGLEQVSLQLFDYHVRTCLLGECDVSPERLDDVSQTVRLWMRFGAPAAQVPD
jgi:hypothetical protein